MRRWYQQLKNAYHFWQAYFWRVYYGWPDRGMNIYGVTGTNGKTTTCYVFDGILTVAQGRERVGMLTTVMFRIGEREEVNETKLTTLPSCLVYRKLREMHAAGVTHVTLEMTSHALDQNRLAGVRLAGGIILNIEREHLDYHGTMKDYARAKGKMLRYLKPGVPVVVKGGVLKNFQFSIFNFQTVGLIRFTAGQARSVTTPLPGDWNKENVLAASLLAQAIGVSEGAISRGVAALKRVPGRMEWVVLPVTTPGEVTRRLPQVLVDYAVTPGALERLYEYVRSGTKGKIYAVLGAAGLRDRGKRPDMARAVARFADEIVLTREDPWTEDEKQIFSDLEQGLKDLTVPRRRIIDRREAIKYCLRKAGSDDVVVVTGKGAERGMAVGKKIVPWNDREVIQELLMELSNDQ